MNVDHVSVPVTGRVPHGQTNCYLFGTDQALLVDPPARSDDIDALLADREVDSLAVTHHHPDHVGGVAHYADRLDATVWCRSGREAAFETATGVSADRTFREGTVIDADRPVTVLDLPGHTPEHAGFEAGGSLVAGDLVIAEGSVVVGAPDGDMRAYLSSLRRVYARAPDAVLPGHGPTIDEPRVVCERLVRHRYGRERRIVEAVEDGARTLDEITDAAYEKDISAVRGMAVATVRAHVEKLAAERRLAWDGARATPA